jgi:hypothetical protein
MKDQVRTDERRVTANGFPLAAPQIEKFSAAELSNLRNELFRGQLDSWQAADLAANFLAIGGLEISRCSLDCLQSALEGVAYIQ